MNNGYRLYFRRVLLHPKETLTFLHLEPEAKDGKHHTEKFPKNHMKRYEDFWSPREEEAKVLEKHLYYNGRPCSDIFDPSRKVGDHSQLGLKYHVWTSQKYDDI